MRILLISLFIMYCSNPADNNDCLGIPNGTAYINECGYCVVETGDQSCILGCDEIWATAGNEAVIDECGVCGGDGTTCNQ